MTKKRITRNQWEYIGKYNPAAKWLRPLCSYTLEEIEGGYRRICRVPWLIYLVIFIPVHLVQFFYCVYDGGLKEFEIAERLIGYDNLQKHGENCGAYEKAKEIWEKA